MPQINSKDNWVNQDYMPPPEFRPTRVVSLVDTIAFIRRRFSIILLTCLPTLGIAILYLITAVPTFTAKPQLFLDSRAAAGDAASVSNMVATQITIIKS